MVPSFWYLFSPELAIETDLITASIQLLTRREHNFQFPNSHFYRALIGAAWTYNLRAQKTKAILKRICEYLERLSYTCSTSIAAFLRGENQSKLLRLRLQEN